MDEGGKLHRSNIKKKLWTLIVRLPVDNDNQNQDYGYDQANMNA